MEKKIKKKIFRFVVFISSYHQKRYDGTGPNDKQN